MEAVISETVKRYTYVYDAQGNKIDELEGFKTFEPNEVADRLPIQYKHVEIVTRVLNSVKIEK